MNRQELKLPPQNLDVEEKILATVFMDAETFEEIQELLEPDDFYKSAYRLIYEAFVSLKADGRKVDIETVVAELEKSGNLKKAGGAAVLAKIMDNSPVSINPEGHARILKEYSEKRKLLTIGQNLTSGSLNNKSVKDLLKIANDGLEKIQLPRQKIEIISFAEIIEEDPQMESLIENFLNKGEGLIIHAAGGVGKSALSVFIAAMAAKNNPDLLFDEFRIKKQMVSVFIQSENSKTAINTRVRGMVGNDQEAKRILGNLFSPQIYGDVLTTGKSFEDPAFIQYCVDMIQTIEDRTGRTLDLFIIDPLISFHNGDENDASRMRAALDGITEISQRTDITPIVLHHNNRNDDYRGSSAVYDWARNMISLKRIYIGQDRIIGFHKGESVNRIASVPAIEVTHEKANNLPLFNKFTIAMDHNFRFSRVADAIPAKIQERCLEVQQALKDLGGFAESNSKLSQALSELTGRSKRTCSTDIATAAEHDFIKRDKAIKGGRGAYSYCINE